MIYKKLKSYLLRKQLETAVNLSNKEMGDKGEIFASLILEIKGYRIIGRNLKIAGGEIDILAVKDEDLYVFEVKLRTSDKFGNASESITKKKKKKLNKITNLMSDKRYKTIQLKLFAIDIKSGKLYYDIIDV
jgi:Holliday junction resolvase-like predicted endonuclease